MKKFTAHFTPQAWVNDYAIDVDLEGPDTFDVTDEINTDHDGIIPDDDYDLDDLHLAKAAPAWVREWSGPFYVRVHEET